MKKPLSLFLFLSLTLSTLCAATSITRLRTLKTGKAPTFADLSADGRYLYITNFADDEVQVVDCQSFKSLTRFYAGYEPLGIAVSPVGDKLFVTNRPGLVKVIDIKSHEIIDDIKVGGMPSNIVISPKGYRAFVTNWGRAKIGHLDIIDTATHDLLDQVKIGIRPMAAAVAPTGDLVFAACGGSNDLYVIDVSNQKVVKKMGVGLAP